MVFRCIDSLSRDGSNLKNSNGSELPNAAATQTLLDTYTYSMPSPLQKLVKPMIWLIILLKWPTTKLAQVLLFVFTRKFLFTVNELGLPDYTSKVEIYNIILKLVHEIQLL